MTSCEYYFKHGAISFKKILIMSLIRIIEVAGCKVEVYDASFAWYYIPIIEDIHIEDVPEFRVNSKGFRRLSNYIRMLRYRIRIEKKGRKMEMLERMVLNEVSKNPKNMDFTKLAFMMLSYYLNDVRPMPFHIEKKIKGISVKDIIKAYSSVNI